MKRITFSILSISILLIATFGNIQAQTLFGTTSTGGDSSGGVIFKYDLPTQSYSVASSFASYPAIAPMGYLIQATDGNFYGMTSQGGAQNGTIFRVTLSGAYTILASFNYTTTGDGPKGSLTEGYDGNLYGTTSQGGANGYGTLFRYSITGDSITPLVSFNGSGNGSSAGNMVQASDSNLYGTTYQGGSFNNGTLFSYSIKNNTLITLVNFNNNPGANLIQGFDGNLYGVTNSGGTGYGSIFQCTTTGTLTTLASFNNTNGRSPCGVIQAADSGFYGMSNEGGSSNDGTLFKYKASSGITVLVNFNGTNGNQANSTLIQGTDGYLYGMTPAGGSEGNIFKCSTTGTFTTLVNFTGPNGDWPEGSLIQATDGNLYGMTSAGGPAAQGNLFSCTTTGTITNLVNFGSSSNGSFPFSGLVQGANGNLYGTTNAGGISNAGTLYKFTLSDTLTTLASFSNDSANEPIGSPIQATDGDFYGMTFQRGTGGSGSVYKYDPLTHTMNDSLVSFNGTNGGMPYGSLLQASDGNLYGVTYNGGSGFGVLFKLTMSGVYSVLVNFSGGNQANPYGNLIQAADGNLYGTTSGVSGYYGSIFQYVISTNTLNTVFNFSGTNGANPQGGLIQGFDGNLYGTTYYGGTLGYGTIFKCTISGTLTTLVNFDGTNGEYPASSLLQASDSNLYGVTKGGTAINPNGTLFKCSTSGTFTNLMTFNGTTGKSPYGVNLIEVEGVKVVVTAPGCTSQTITANPAWNGKSPYTYSWSTGASTSSISNITTAGTYTVTVSDGNGITYTGSVTLPAYTPISAGVTATNLICHGDNSGTAEVTASGGGSPYTYVWSSAQTSSAINNITAGTYSVTVTDKYGCTANGSVTITEPATALTATMADVNIKCTGLNNGSATVTANGGISPYTYSWNTGKTTSGISNLAPGDYSVTVTDNNGCSIHEYDTVQQPVSTLDSVRICMVSVDTGSLHNIIVWNSAGLNNIDSFKVYYLNSSSVWQKIAELPFSASQYTDTSSINNPNANTVRYCLTGVDSCGDEELITSSPWQNTMYINNSPPGTFIWAGTGYLIQNVTLPVTTYYLYRDSLGNGNWEAIDSVSGTQNKMTDPNYSKYASGRWYVGARLNVAGCPNPIGRVEASSHVSSRSNVQYKNPLSIAQLESNFNISVYPNPASNTLNIKFNNIKESSTHFSIMDVTGRIIMEMENEVIPSGNMTINVASLPTGIYFIKITTSASSQVVKFIKE